MYNAQPNAQPTHAGPVGGTNKPKVVILGSGYAGAQCAKSIQEKLGDTVSLTVIERRNVNIHKIASARAAVCGNSYSDRVLIPNDSLIAPGMGQLVRGVIRQVTDAFVIMDDGVRVDFDFLVCATGAINFSICEPPLRYSDKDSMKKFYDKVHKKIRSAERILIIGGGASGVELAGEIKYEYNSKVVTIVHSGARLLSKTRPHPGKGFDKKLRARLDEIGVTVLTGQKIIINWKEHGNKPYISSGGIEYITDKGRSVNADLVLLCAGKKVTNNIYPPEWLDDITGEIKVKRTMQVLNHDNIFCIGDLNDIPDNKQAVFAGKHGITAAENIKRLITNRKPKKYTPGFGFKKSFIFVTVGRKKGAGHLGWFNIGSSLVTSIKGKDLSTKTFWKLWNKEESIPKEIGGPSLGNKLGTVARPPNLMQTDGMSYNIQTRSMEVKQGGGGTLPKVANDQASNRHQSMESVTSLADMYKDENMNSSAKSSLLAHDPSKQIGQKYGQQAEDRNGMVSFVGSLDGSGPENSSGKSNTSIMKPMSPQEYSTLERSTRGGKHVSNNGASNFSAVPLPKPTPPQQPPVRKPGNPLGTLNYGQKPERNEIISFVGAGPVVNNDKQP